MEKIDDRAFPHNIGYGGAGISKLEYFAGQALIGLLAKGISGVTVTGLAEKAFAIAKAMLKAGEGQ